MHQSSLARQILTAVLDRADGASRVLAVTLSAESLRFCAAGALPAQNLVKLEAGEPCLEGTTS